MANSDETGRVLRAYAKAWLASDLEKVLASYHDDIELHYMGESPLAGTHRGRDAAFAVLAQASTRTARKLINVEDVLVRVHCEFSVCRRVDRHDHILPRLNCGVSRA